jgi:putative endonuclease
MWIIYILECSDTSLYTGITNDLKRRLEEHRTGRGATYTPKSLEGAVYGISRHQKRGAHT